MGIFNGKRKKSIIRRIIEQAVVIIIAVALVCVIKAEDISGYIHLKEAISDEAAFDSFNCFSHSYIDDTEEYDEECGIVGDEMYITISGKDKYMTIKYNDCKFCVSTDPNGEEGYTFDTSVIDAEAMKEYIKEKSAQIEAGAKAIMAEKNLKLNCKMTSWEAYSQLCHNLTSSAKHFLAEANGKIVEILTDGESGNYIYSCKNELNEFVMSTVNESPALTGIYETVSSPDELAEKIGSSGIWNKISGILCN